MVPGAPKEVVEPRPTLSAAPRSRRPVEEVAKSTKRAIHPTKAPSTNASPKSIKKSAPQPRPRLKRPEVAFRSELDDRRSSEIESPRDLVRRVQAERHVGCFSVYSHSLYLIPL